MSLVVKLFNVIQQSQHASAAAEETLKSQRGTGKPTLPAPSLAKAQKKKGKQKEQVTAKDGELWRTFLLGEYLTPFLYSSCRPG